MLHYILQVIAFQLIFLVAFELFLKKETFFSYNRAYLLVTPVLAMLLPLLKFPMLQNAIPAENFVMLPEVFIGANPEAATSPMAVSTTSEATQTINWWLLAYSAGSLFSLGIFFHKFRILKQLFAHKPVLQNREMKIVEVPQSKIACTFYNTIFLGAELSEKEREQILSHEMVHVRQRHTLDLLFFEFLKIVFWFNPLIYIYQSRISACHEFLADAGVVKKVKKQTYYQQLLNSAFNTENISFINPFFNQSILKKRIVMLQKSRSKAISKIKYLILLPLISAMIMFVSGTSAWAQSQEVLTIQVGDIDNMTDAEKQLSNTSFDEVMKKRSHKALIITDGSRSLEFSVDPETGAESGKIYHNTEKEVLDEQQTVSNIPYAIVEEVPVFPGCEDLETNDERKECTSNKVNNYINLNFDMDKVQKAGVTGTTQTYVRFKISTSGDIVDVEARGPHPALIEEAERVVRSLPKMNPGKQKGKEVAVLYSVPIKMHIAGN